MVCWVRTVKYSPCAISIPTTLQNYYISTSGKGIERHVIAGLEDPECAAMESFDEATSDGASIGVSSGIHTFCQVESGVCGQSMLSRVKLVKCKRRRATAIGEMHDGAREGRARLHCLRHLSLSPPCPPHCWRRLEVDCDITRMAWTRYAALHYDQLLTSMISKLRAEPVTCLPLVSLSGSAAVPGERPHQSMEWTSSIGVG
jgi:hypothetical protein